MAVPGSVAAGRNRGAHALIRDGAKLVECADDIVDELGWPAPSDSADRAEVSSGWSTSSVDPLLSAMHGGQAYDLEGLTSASGVSGVQLLPRLLELELNGLVQRVAGGRFMRR